jgi:outer membrane protein assembly factor BamB
LLIALATALATHAHAGDWRQFRGPLGNGVSDDAAVPAKLDGPSSIAWQADLPGRGLSSPIIVGERVFVTCSSGPRQERLHVICLNAKDGTKRWERQFWSTGRTMAHDKTNVAASTPVSDGERVFAIFSSNDLVCLDLDGNLLWLRGITRDYPNASNSLGMASSPIVLDGLVIAQVENDSDSFAIAIDIATGENRWKIARPKTANWVSPVVINQGGQKNVVLQSGNGLVAVEPQTGKTVWEFLEGGSTIPSSAASGETIYVPSKGLTALQPAGPGKPPRQLWRTNQLAPGTASPVVAGDRVFTINNAGVLNCGEAATGNRLWQLRLKGPFSATPVFAAGRLYFFNEKGIAQVVDTTKPEGEIVSEFNLGQTILGTPSIANGAIYVRSDGRLWKFGKS